MSLSKFIVKRSPAAGLILLATLGMAGCSQEKSEVKDVIRPVKVGDVLSVYTEIESIGRTSMRIHIEAWAKRFRTTLHEKVTEATFAFVAIDEEGRPRPVPQLPENPNG